MSMNIVLSEDVRKDPLFKLHKDGGTAEVQGVTVFLHKGPPFVMSELSSGIPTAVAMYVEGFSVYEWLPMLGGREMGVYRHESAVAEIDVIHVGPNQDRQKQYKIRLTAKSIEDAHELIHLFRTGKIRPVESFEGPQGGKSRAELEREVDKAKKDVASLAERLKNAEEAEGNERAARETLVKRLRTLESEIEARTGIVFMKKATLVEKLEQVRFGY